MERLRGDLQGVARLASGRDFVAAICTLAGQAHAGEAVQAWAVLQARGAAGLLAQDQPVQG